jgi:hypothetical protein
MAKREIQYAGKFQIPSELTRFGLGVLSGPQFRSVHRKTPLPQ